MGVKAKASKRAAAKAPKAPAKKAAPKASAPVKTPAPSRVADGHSIDTVAVVNRERGNDKWTVFEARTEDGVVITVMGKNENAVAAFSRATLTVDFS